MKLHIITGKSTREISYIQESLCIQKGYFIPYPEAFNHPTELAGKIVKETMDCHKDTTMVILTFSKDVFNIVGYLVYKEIISSDKIEINMMIDNSIKTLYYDKLGCIEDFPIEYFCPNVDDYLNKK